MCLFGGRGQGLRKVTRYFYILFRTSFLLHERLGDTPRRVAKSNRPVGDRVVSSNLVSGVSKLLVSEGEFFPDLLSTLVPKSL